MPGIATTFANDLLKLIFNATAIANLADNAATSPVTNLYLSAHTADPGQGGSQTTNEAAYTGYARIALARTTGGWTVTSNSVSPQSTVSWPACTAGTATLTHFGVGTGSTGTGKMLISGTITPNIAVSTGVTPQLTAASTLTIA